MADLAAAAGTPPVIMQGATPQADKSRAPALLFLELYILHLSLRLRALRSSGIPSVIADCG